MKPIEAAQDTMDRRMNDLLEWLRENAPGIDEEQAHLNAGSTERAYWHYGYLVALRDIRDWLFGGDNDTD